jgi:hypothetical protein
MFQCGVMAAGGYWLDQRKSARIVNASPTLLGCSTRTFTLPRLCVPGPLQSSHDLCLTAPVKQCTVSSSSSRYQTQLRDGTRSSSRFDRTPVASPLAIVFPIGNPEYLSATTATPQNPRYYHLPSSLPRLSHSCPFLSRASHPVTSLTLHHPPPQSSQSPWPLHPPS